MNEKKALCALAALAVSASIAACSAATTAGLAADTHHRAAQRRVHAAPGQVTLDRVVLRRSDVPRGYVAKPHDRSGDKHSARDQRRMAHCLGIRNTAPDHLASANSADFSGGGLQISSSVDSYRRRGDVANDSALARSHKAVGCLRAELHTGIAADLPAGAAVRDLRLSMHRRSAGTPHNVLGTITGSLVVTAGGRQVPMHLALTLITGPFVEASVTSIGIGRRVPPALQRRLARTVAHRAARV